MRKYLVALLFGFSLVLSLSPNVIGGDCNLEIRDGHGAEDLNRVLHCLDERIKTLEVRNADLEKRLGGGGKIVNPASFDAGPFEASVRGASIDKNTIFVNVMIKNKTTEPLLLIMDSGTRPVLVDEKSGKPMNFMREQGITTTDSGQVRAGYVKEDHCTPVSVSGSITINLSFVSDGNPERLQGLTLHLFRLKDKQFTKMTVPLSVMLDK